MKTVSARTPIRVLLVEDDEEDYVLTRDLLRKAGAQRFELEWAKTLQAGIEAIARVKPQVILLDLSLPDCRGLETFQRTRARAPDLPIVVLTGLSDREVGDRAVQQGAQDYLSKGAVDAEGLARGIRYAIERNRAEVALRRYRDHLAAIVEKRTAELSKANEQLAREVEERKAAEAEKEKLQGQLLRAQKLEAVGRLAGGVAHEFNNALTIVTGYADLLLNGMSEGDPMRADVREIAGAGQRAAALIRKLLAFSREQVLRVRVTEMNAFVKEAEGLIRPVLGERIELRIVPSKDALFANVDARQVEQAMMNLALNGRDAMPNGGVFTVTVRECALRPGERRGDAERGGRYACLTVADTGAGMDGGTLARIFEPFFTTKNAAGGYGLGLSVVYGILKQHGGWVEAESNPGGGARFTLYFPLAEIGRTAAASAAGAQAARVDGGAGKVLLVEDEARVRAFARRVLCSRGFEVVEASSAREARERFERNDGQCGIVFSDVVLPDESGVALVDALRERQPALKVLLCSGYAGARGQRDLIEKRGYPFLAKPYSTESLLAKLGEVLRVA